MFQQKNYIIDIRLSSKYSSEHSISFLFCILVVGDKILYYQVSFQILHTFAKEIQVAPQPKPNKLLITLTLVREPRNKSKRNFGTCIPRNFSTKILFERTVYRKIQKKSQKISINEFSTYWHEPQTLKIKRRGKHKTEKISI